MNQNRMGNPMSDRVCRPRALIPLVVILFAGGPFALRAAQAQSAPAAAASAPIVNSALDDRLLYQLLVGEMALNDGDAGLSLIHI